MPNFITRPDPTKRAKLEAERLQTANRMLELQLANALAQIPAEEDETEEECDIPALKKKLAFQQSVYRGHQNLCDSLYGPHVPSAFKCAGKSEVLCELQKIAAINVAAAAGHVAYTEFCIANCELEGQSEVRQQSIDEVYALLEGVDLDDIDPTCAYMISQVIGDS